MNPYATNKAAHHPDRLMEIAKGGQPNPVHLQLILSDLCNHDCVPAGTLVECPDGERPIETIQVGDYVCGPDGSVVKVDCIGNRLADDVFEIRCDGRVVRATGDHPILTQNGWKAAKDLSANRDSAVVRLRMRSVAEMEPKAEALGSVHLRSCADEPNIEICKEGQRFAKENERRGSSFVPLRVRYSSECPWVRGGELLVELPNWALCSRNDEPSFSTAPTTCSGANAHQQSDEGSKHRSQGQTFAGDGSIAVQDRTEVSELREGSLSPDQFPRKWSPLDQSKESRLPSVEAEEGDRDHLEWHFQRWLNSTPESSKLRDSNGGTLPAIGMGVSGDLLSRRPSQEDPYQAIDDPGGLRLAELAVERGLALRPIDSVRPVSGSIRVYNISCPPVRSYLANGIAISNCNFCAYRMSGYSSNQLFGVTDADGTYNHNPNRMIETDKALEILRDAQAMGIRAVQFTGGGEPTVHPDFASIVLYAQGLGLETAIVSNGQKLNGHAAVAVRGSSWIRISIDAGTAESYQQIRRVRPGVFETVWKNVEAVVAARNGASPYVGLGFVVTKENWTEIPLFVGRARDAGVDNVRLAAVFTTEGAAYFEGFEEDAARLCRAAKALETDRFAVADMFRERAKDLHQGPPDYERCAYMHLTTYIGADLGVYRCCVLAYNTRGLIGSLKDQRLSDLWASEQKRKDFAGFDARGCDLCQFNERNREMNAMIDTIPTEHGNFV